MSGRVAYIGVRAKRNKKGQGPTRSGEVTPVQYAEVDARGLVGDRYKKDNGKRAVTLFQMEHLPVVETLAGVEVRPEALRRNIGVEGINLMALRMAKAQFRIGSATLQATGTCHPCIKMDTTIGPGGLDAMQGHGGINARVIEGGTIGLGDTVALLSEEDDA